jgi:hypothetical protein
MDFGHVDKRSSGRGTPARRMVSATPAGITGMHRPGSNGENASSMPEEPDFRGPHGRGIGAAPARGEGGGRGVQLRGVELNQVVGSGGVETDKFTVDPSSQLRHLSMPWLLERSSTTTLAYSFGCI